MPEPLQVTAAEAGQKLLQFLSRRFEEPQSVLHRWIRTGQVRINGGRAKPFDRVELNDEIRVPPFAGAGTKAERVPASSGGKELPPIVAETPAFDTLHAALPFFSSLALLLTSM